jgi:leader peptidase (prepilin peptidase)/N-methyltransferase
VPSSVTAALLLGLLGLVTGWFVPALIRRIPEPEPEPDADEPDHEHEHERDEADTTAPPEEPDPEPEPAKELYADIAALPGLAWRCSVATAVVGAMLGWAVGLQWSLLFLAYLAPVGVALSVVDWRTHLLPTKVIAPSYAVVVVLAVVAALPGQDWSSLLRGLGGWAIYGGIFVLLWWFFHLGYGDVRLAGLLGFALAVLGWNELILGMYATVFIGGLGGVVMALLRITRRRHYPYGPFMCLGALVGVVWGDAVTIFYVP